MKNNAYYNGVFTDYAGVRIPLSDRAVFFGDGVYDVIIGRRGIIYQPAQHVKRLLGNAEAIALKLDISANDILCVCEELIHRAAPDDGFMLYVQLSRKGGKREHVFDSNAGYNILITLTEFNYSVSPAPISLITTEDIRYRMCNIKTVNLLPAVLASSEAARSGNDECVFVRNGIVTECSHSNIHILCQGSLITHPKDRDILPGICAQNLIRECDRLGITVREEGFTVRDMLAADEVLVSSTTKFVRRCSRIDGTECASRSPELAQKLRNALLDDFLLSCT